MAYATAVITLATTSSAPISTDGQPEMHIYKALIPSGGTPVEAELHAKPGSKIQEAMAQQPLDARLLVAGFLSAIDLPDDGGSLPIVTLTMLCPATPEQFLNEVTIVGRVGGKARESEKSSRVPVAVNRYLKPPAGEEKPIEVTDWFPVRGFGFSKAKIEALEKGTLIEVSGSLSQMQSSKGSGFFEIRARQIRSHGKSKGRGGAVAPAASSAVGYTAEEFEGGAGQEDDWA
jgi:single-stranded DNA-binding protein